MKNKLTLADAVQLRELAAAGKLSVKQAARTYGVGQETIRRAVRGETFGAVQAPAALSADAAASEARFRARINPLEEL